MLQKGYRAVHSPVRKNVWGEIQRFNEVLQIILSSEDSPFSIPGGHEMEVGSIKVNDGLVMGCFNNGFFHCISM